MSVVDYRLNIISLLYCSIITVVEQLWPIFAADRAKQIKSALHGNLWGPKMLDVIKNWIITSDIYYIHLADRLHSALLHAY